MAIEDSVTRAIYGLKDKPEEAKGILLGVKPAISAGSLVWALGDPLLRAGSQEVLVIYGASDDTVKPLVASLGNPLYRGPAAYVLERYGASPITVNPLVGALGDESQREGSITVLTFYRASRVTVKPLVASLGNNLPTRTASIGVLTAYGPSKVTIQPLVGALLELSRKDAAARVILNYGRKALRHIGEPIPGTELFTPLTEIIGLIRAGNP